MGDGGISINSWQSVENLILRPPRSDSYTRDDLLGGPDGEFAVVGVDGASLPCFRMDVELKNGRGQRLVASHYLPCERWKSEKQLPCVVYCHGNAGCRMDANVVAFALLRRGITCFCFDFAGSGLSDGSLVTLGAHEAGDLDTVVRFLRLQGRTSNIAVWGRSMGAVTAALFARTNLSIAGVVLDSPFCKLTDLIRDIVARDIVSEAPGVLVSAAILALRTSIRRRAGVDIAAIDVLAAAPECYQPALFVHARADELIYPSHSQALAAAWAGDARVLLVGEHQSHNTLRPRHIVASCVHFLCNVLGGGLKDTEALFMNVGDGTPPPPVPQAADPQGARAALLQRMWLQQAEEEQKSEALRGAAGDTDDDEEEEEEEEEEDEEDASEEGSANGREEEYAGAGGAGEAPSDDDDDWEATASAAAPRTAAATADASVAALRLSDPAASDGATAVGV